MQVADILPGRRVFFGGQQNGVVIGGQVEKVGFQAIGSLVFYGIRVDGDKQVRVLCICKGGSLFKRKVLVGCAGHQHFTPELFSDFCGQLFADLQHDVLFMDPFVIPGSPVILTAMPGIDNDAADPQRELPGNGSGRDFSLGGGSLLGRFSVRHRLLALFSADINDDPERVFQRKNFIGLKRFDVHHYPHGIFVVLACAGITQQVVVYGNLPSCAPVQLGLFQVYIQPLRLFQRAVFFEQPVGILRLIVRINNNPGIIRV